jgi:hypothetical protein
MYACAGLGRKPCICGHLQPLIDYSEKVRKEEGLRQ